MTSFAELNLELSFTVQTAAGAYHIEAKKFQFDHTEGGERSAYLLSGNVTISGPDIVDTVTIDWSEYVNNDGSIETQDDYMSTTGFAYWRDAMPDVDEYNDAGVFSAIDSEMRRKLRCYDLLDLAMHSRRDYAEYVAERERLEARITGWDRKLASDLVERLDDLRDHIEDHDEFAKFEQDEFDPYGWLPDHEIEAAIVPGVTVIDVDEANRAVVVEADGTIGWVVPTWWSLAHHLEYAHREDSEIEMDHGCSTLRVELDESRWIGLGLNGTIELVEDDEQIVADDYASQDLEDYHRALLDDPIGFATRLWADFAPSEEEGEDDLAA